MHRPTSRGKKHSCEPSPPSLQSVCSRAYGGLCRTQHLRYRLHFGCPTRNAEPVSSHSIFDTVFTFAVPPATRNQQVHPRQSSGYLCCTCCLFYQTSYTRGCLQPTNLFPRTLQRLLCVDRVCVFCSHLVCLDFQGPVQSSIASLCLPCGRLTRRGATSNLARERDVPVNTWGST